MYIRYSNEDRTPPLGTPLCTNLGESLLSSVYIFLSHDQNLMNFKTLGEQPVSANIDSSRSISTLSKADCMSKKATSTCFFFKKALLTLIERFDKLSVHDFPFLNPH